MPWIFCSYPRAAELLLDTHVQTGLFSTGEIASVAQRVLQVAAYCGRTGEKLLHDFCLHIASSALRNFTTLADLEIDHLQTLLDTVRRSALV